MQIKNVLWAATECANAIEPAASMVMCLLTDFKKFPTPPSVVLLVSFVLLSMCVTHYAVPLTTKKKKTLKIRNA